jgi:glucose-6-phosphate isomerase
MSTLELWSRFQKYYWHDEALGVSVDISRMKFSDAFIADMESKFPKAFSEMARLEKGEIVNPDENRMVGHYWLRDAASAPSADITKAINDCVADMKAFAADVHAGKIRGADGTFKNILVVGIGGSALGPQFVSAALTTPADKAKVYFFDNTDPDGMDRVFDQLNRKNLGETLTIVISKSGGTKETRNGMLEAKKAYELRGLDFSKHAVAVTGDGSELYKYASSNGWIKIFPMWDWVGGRTSELSAVGLLPAALQGLNIQGMLDGAKAMDERTRVNNFHKNPAALLAAMWFYAGEGRGKKDMVVLPYKDRLELFSRYLQQLVMESLGKEKDLDGNVVYQGIAVYGNKGSTDQHAYVQQLRDGVKNFFVTFVEVLKDRAKKSIEVEPGVTSGDYLSGFYQGTRRALYESDRESTTITLRDVDAGFIGKLIALYERTVGFYATLINTNAYHQPGVEAGKKAATAVLNMQGKVINALKGGSAMTVEQIAKAVGQEAEVETVFKVIEHLAANTEDSGVSRTLGSTPFNSTYKLG